MRRPQMRETRAGVKNGEIEGAATGVRVGGAVAGGIGLLLEAYVISTYVVVGSDLEMNLLFCAVFLYWIIRPWFMGMRVEGDDLHVRSWYRNRVFPLDATKGASAVAYQGFGLTAPVGSLLFVGAVAMLCLHLENGREVRLPSTLNTMKRIISIRRRLEAHGIPRAHSPF